jgi:cbb3-type cytochrome oxidase subunit 3
MGLILLEALAAGLVFILIIWWTMFSGRKKGELHDEAESEADRQPEDRDPPPKA